MGFLKAATAALALLAVPMIVAKFCNGRVCYSELVSLQQIAYRVAIPDTAARGMSFDVLLRVVAPSTVGWAGIAWAGEMVNNPGASYQKLSTSTTNSTHWRLDAICTGCSSWQGVGLDPASTTTGIAWAMAARAPAQPSSNTSTISIHSSKGSIDFDLDASKIANFDDVVAALKGGDAMSV